MSIKNKLVTAVTTAGLLAGLFGSAFVPAARAVETDWDTAYAKTPTVFYDMDHSGGFDAGTDKVSAALDGTDANDGAGTAAYPYFLYSPVVNDGGNDGAAMATPGELSILGDTDNCSDAANDDAFCDENGDLLSGTVSAKAVATNGLVVYVTDGAACSADEDDYAATSNTVNINADADIANEPWLICVGVASDDTVGSGTVTPYVNGVAGDAIYVRAVGASKSITLTATYSYVALDLAAAANAALTFKVSDGTNADLNDIFGSSGNVGIANGDLDRYTDGDGLGDDIDAIVDGVSVNLAAATAGLDEESTDYGDAIELDPTNELCDSLATGPAEHADESGDTHSVAIFIDEDNDSTWDSGEVKSNTVTITCTADGTEAIVTAVHFVDADGEALSSAAMGCIDCVYFNFSVDDGYGTPQGYVGDATTLDFGTDTQVFSAFNLDSGADIESSSTGSVDSFDEMVVVDGVGKSSATADFEYTSPTTRSGKMSVTFQLTTGDLQSAVAVEVTDSLTWTAAGSGSGTAAIAAGPKLKTATITISAAAGKLVTVTIEKVSTGKTFTYYRKANASGVAKFTIRRAGTWEVFASYGDDVTDTVTLKK